jgi:hypothetical protein
MSKTAAVKREQFYFDPDGLRSLLRDPNEEPAPVEYAAYAKRASEIVIKAVSPEHRKKRV